MKTLLLIASFAITLVSYSQYSDTISCNGGTLVFAVHYDQQTCDATCNGAYTVEILTGVGPYVYSVTGSGGTYSSALSADINICPQWLSLLVTDMGQGINCSHSFNILALTPNNHSVSTSMTSGLGVCDGSATITVTGGVPPYTYQWYDAGMNPLPGQTNPTINGLCAGTYFVQYWDNTPPCGSGTGGVGSGGSTVVAVVIMDPVTVTITGQYEAVCPGTCTAWITYTVAGGSGTYNDPLNGTAPECDGGAGMITVCDDQGNCGSASYALIGWPPVDIMSSGTDETCPSSCDGTIDFIDNWGALAYSINDGATWQAGSSFTNLCSGFYDQLMVEIPDAGYGGTCFIEVFPDITISSGAGPDTDGDGTCDAADLDDDNDGVMDTNDSAPLDPQQCQDLDNDGCDDCSMNAVSMASPTPWTTYMPNPSNDGIDTDADGLCDSGDPCPNSVSNDVDGDGYCGDVDCDDNDPNAYPGLVWYPDCDGDGYFSSVGITSCFEPASPCGDGLAPDGGWSHVAGNDCDDEDPMEYPGQIWYLDYDGDGYGDPMIFNMCERLSPTDVLNDSDCDDISLWVVLLDFRDDLR